MSLKKLRHLNDRTIFFKRLLLVGIFVFLSFVLYRFLLTFAFESNIIIGILLVWLLTAYVVLPRTHRILTSLYLPDYFIGRAKTGDGMLSDPINLAVIGSRKKLIDTMTAGGWQLADDLNWKTTLKAIRATLLHEKYLNAPFSLLYLLGVKQDLGFQKSIGNGGKKRHHVRFWATPKGWLLPGGFKSDWLGAATFDSHIGLAGFTLQITHKIDENIDEERDFVVSTMKSANKNVQVENVLNYSVGYHSRNGGGDTIKTDGTLPFIYL